MSEPLPPPKKMIALRLQHKNAYDAVAMLFYLCLVYLWGIWVYPLGRDYEHLASQGADMPFLARELFRLEMSWFQGNPVGYHLVNMALMYACMLLIFHFVNIASKGVWWFGTLAACLFMANPVHTESMLNVSGVSDLVPCLGGLGVMAAMVYFRDKPSIPMGILASCSLVGFLVAYPDFLFILYPALTYGMVVRWRNQPWVVPGLIASVCAVVLGLWWAGYDVAQLFGVAYLVFYPIGFLPETMDDFHARPWLGPVAVVTVIVVIWLMHRKIQRPLFVWALASMVMVSAVWNGARVDWVHMVGGGRLLLANVFFVLALIIVIFRIMDNPKWRLPMISMTTMLVVIFFAMQWRSMRAWHEAGQEVKAFQAKALAAQRESGGLVGVLPDIQFRTGAPVCLSESIVHDTSFSKKIPSISLFPVNGDSPERQQIAIGNWSGGGGEIEITTTETATPFRFFSNAGALVDGKEITLRPGSGEQQRDVTVRITNQTPHTLTVAIQGEDLPVTLVPGELTGEEADRDSESDADDQ